MYLVLTTINGQLNVTLVARDIAGNDAMTTISVTIDTIAPTTSSAETGIGWDSADEKETDAADGVKVVMSETIDPDSVQGTDFEIDNVQAVDAVVGTGEGYTANVYLTAASDLDPDATPRVEVVGEVTDPAGNEVDITKDATSEATATDSLAPTVTVSRDVALLADEDEEVVVTIASDEKLVSGGAVVSIIGPANSDANVEAVDASADAPLVHSHTLAISKNAKTGAYGIAVQITDLGNNKSDNLVGVSDEEATVDGNTIVLANGPIADRNFDGVVDGKDLDAGGHRCEWC